MGALSRLKIHLDDISINGGTDKFSKSKNQKADSIKVTGQDHTKLALAQDTDHLRYVMAAEDPYARFTAYFTDGEVIWSNPFARYDASVAGSPIDKESSHSINLVLTILFNILLAAIAAGAVTCIYKLWKRK